MSVDYKRALRLPIYSDTPHAAALERASPAVGQACASDQVFAEALRDDSNQELDWLWLYVQVKTDAQRRYCLERALAINPTSTIALRELAQLRAGE